MARGSRLGGFLLARILRLMWVLSSTTRILIWTKRYSGIRYTGILHGGSIPVHDNVRVSVTVLGQHLEIQLERNVLHSGYSYKFTDEKMWVGSIVAVAPATSRRFIFMGNYPRPTGPVIAHVDFSSLTSKKCELAFFSAFFLKGFEAYFVVC